MIEQDVGHIHIWPDRDVIEICFQIDESPPPDMLGLYNGWIELEENLYGEACVESTLPLSDYIVFVDGNHGTTLTRGDGISIIGKHPDKNPDFTHLECEFTKLPYGSRGDDAYTLIRCK